MVYKAPCQGHALSNAQILMDGSTKDRLYLTLSMDVLTWTLRDRVCVQCQYAIKFQRSNR